MEVTNTLIIDRKFVNRGFLIGPYCPIYGVGGILSFILLRKYLDDPITLFVMSIVLFSLIEYFTSYIMEKLFHVRWWDYSNKKYNINGRICLEAMILFGILGFVFMSFINPYLVRMLMLIPYNISIIIAIIAAMLMFIDFVISFKIINNLKKAAFSIHKDSTEDITKKVRSVLMNKSIVNRRLINAFAKLKVRDDINEKK